MSNNALPQTLKGLVTARGVARGPVFVYHGEGAMVLQEYRVEPGHEENELARLDHAIEQAKRDLENLISVLHERNRNGEAEIFEGHEMLLEDPMVHDETESMILSEHLNAEAALHRVIENCRERFGRMNDPYFRERVRDLDDVERRVQRAFLGSTGGVGIDLKSPCIIVADDLTPSETMQLPGEKVLGFATNGGSPTSHVALLARAMGLPAVTGLVDITTRVTVGEEILLDGTNGEVTLNPTPEQAAAFEQRLMEQRLQVPSKQEGRRAGALKSGGDIPLLANVHPGLPLESLLRVGARSIGLYRSEYLWVGREEPPSEDEQFEAYRAVAEFAATLESGGSVTIRAFDIGGDKVTQEDTVSRSAEDSSFLGNRSIRFLLANREILRAQMRAVLRASVYGSVRFMYPMISCVDEMKVLAEELEASKHLLDSQGLEYDHHMLIGAMVEVPAAALNAEALAKYVDFFSIGTNDLIQYTMAADRTNEAVAQLYQPLNPAVLRLEEMTIATARKHGIQVAVCGESASDPVVGLLLASMGVDALSMSATYIPLLAGALAHLTQKDLADYHAFVMALSTDATEAERHEACLKWLRTRLPECKDLLS